MTTYKNLINGLIADIKKSGESHEKIANGSFDAPPSVKDYSIAVTLINNSFIQKLEKLHSDYNRINNKGV